ncbi:MAG TPA: hypothetical protein VIC34_00260 [Croceibacterium sp.]|jgi:hypothetical protein
MTSLKRGLCWGAAIVLNAAGNWFGLIDDKTAETLFIVLPIVAVITMGGGRACLPRRRNKAA